MSLFSLTFLISRVHLKRKHYELVGGGELKCEYCDGDKNYKIQESLRVHQLHYNPEKLDPTPHLGFKHVCEECSAEFNSSQSLKYHVTPRHGEGLACPHCSYRATSPNQLKEHVRPIHEKVKFYCEQCGFEASFKLQNQPGGSY